METVFQELVTVKAASPGTTWSVTKHDLLPEPYHRHMLMTSRTPAGDYVVPESIRGVHVRETFANKTAIEVHGRVRYFLAPKSRVSLRGDLSGLDTVQWFVEDLPFFLPSLRVLSLDHAVPPAPELVPRLEKLQLSSVSDVEAVPAYPNLRHLCLFSPHRRSELPVMPRLEVLELVLASVALSRWDRIGTLVLTDSVVHGNRFPETDEVVVRNVSFRDRYDDLEAALRRFPATTVRFRDCDLIGLIDLPGHTVIVDRCDRVVRVNAAAVVARNCRNLYRVTGTLVSMTRCPNFRPAARS